MFLSLIMKRGFPTAHLMLACITLCLCLSVAHAATSGDAGQTGKAAPFAHTDPDPAKLKAKWGIEIVSFRLGAGGSLLDFRYKVLDPEKAAPLADRKLRPFLIDTASGAHVVVPAPAKVGALRNAPHFYKANRNYFIQFANPGKLFNSGSNATLVIGDFKLKHLTVQ